MIDYLLQIIPIESSMGDNRPRFPLYLHLTLAQVSVILGSFGVLGYLIYGDNVPQIMTDTLPSSIFAQLVRVTLMIAVLFTYPLQLYPVIQITESVIFKRRIGKRKEHLAEVVAGPSTNLNSDEVREYQSINFESNSGSVDQANLSYAQDHEGKDLDPLIKPTEDKVEELDYMVSQSVCLSACLPVCLSAVCLSVCLSAVCLSVCLSAVCLSVCLSAVCLSVCFVQLFIYQ
jgi:hypothetical protein